MKGLTLATQGVRPGASDGGDPGSKDSVGRHSPIALPPRKGGGLVPYGLAQIYAALNDKEQSFKWLEIAYADRAVWMSYLAVDPVFYGLHLDQRFQELLGRVHLLPQQIGN